MRSLLLSMALVSLASAAQAPHASPTQADELVGKGIAAQQSGNFTVAIENYRKALAIRPQMAEARANLGAALAAAGQFDAAIAEDKLALVNAPDKTGVRLNLGLAYYKKGDFQNARPEFEAVHAVRSRDLSVAMLLGYCYVKLNRGKAAVDLLTSFEQSSDGNTDFEFVLASALIQAGKEDRGIPLMEKVAHKTTSAEPYVIAGSARLQLRQFREASVDLDAAVKLDPSIPGLSTMDGQAHDALGETEQAIPAFQAALRADPRDFAANLYLGTIRLKERDLENAKPLLELALQLEPDAPQARLQNAKLFAMTGRYAEAAAMLEALEKADPNWLDPHVELAPVYYKLHRPQDGERERQMVEQIEARQQKAGPAKN